MEKVNTIITKYFKLKKAKQWSKLCGYYVKVPPKLIDKKGMQ